MPVTSNGTLARMSWIPLFEASSDAARFPLVSANALTLTLAPPCSNQWSSFALVFGKVSWKGGVIGGFTLLTHEIDLLVVEDVVLFRHAEGREATGAPAEQRAHDSAVALAVAMSGVPVVAELVRAQADARGEVDAQGGLDEPVRELVVADDAEVGESDHAAVHLLAGHQVGDVRGRCRPGSSFHLSWNCSRSLLAFEDG